MNLTKEILRLEAEEMRKPAKNDSFVKAVRKCIQYTLSHPLSVWESYLPAKTSPNKISAAILAGGGLGDILRTNVLLQAFSVQYPEFIFDVFLNEPSHGPFLFGKLGNVRNFYYEHFFRPRKYYYAFGLDTLQLTRIIWQKKDKIPPALLQIRGKINSLLDMYQKHGEHAWHYIVRESVLHGKDYLDMLALSAGIETLGIKKPLVHIQKNNPLQGKKYITFSTSSNIRDGLNETATKCWPVPHWQELIEKIKNTYPQLKIVQLGEQNTTPIHGADVSLLGKTNMETAFAILKDAILHIDCDCGLMHAAQAVETKCCILWGPTCREYVSYSENCNIAAPFCGNCWHITEDWNKKCPLGFPKAQCMHSLTAEAVFQQISDLLKTNL